MSIVDDDDDVFYPGSNPRVTGESRHQGAPRDVGPEDDQILIPLAMH